MYLVNGTPRPSPSRPSPAAYARTGVTPDVLIDFTPAMHQQALDLVKNYKMGPIYTPPVVSRKPGPLGTLMLGPANGGTNWPGGSFNPENHTVYVYACNSCLEPIGLVPPPPDLSDAALRGRQSRTKAHHDKRRGHKLSRRTRHCPR